MKGWHSARPATDGQGPVTPVLEHVLCVGSYAKAAGIGRSPHVLEVYAKEMGCRLLQGLPFSGGNVGIASLGGKLCKVVNIHPKPFIKWGIRAWTTSF